MGMLVATLIGGVGSDAAACCNVIRIVGPCAIVTVTAGGV